MRGGRWRSLMALLLGGTALAVSPGTASATNAEHVEWTTGQATSWCDDGVDARTCYYDLCVPCSEIAVIGVQLASCSVSVTATVRIVPVVQAGRTVGCTSITQGVTGQGSYNSRFDEFDNSNISNPFWINIDDTFADGKPGVAHFAAYSSHGDSSSQDPETWVVEGTMVASCAPNADLYSSVSRGHVDVQV
jgi:hypothetical protein